MTEAIRKATKDGNDRSDQERQEVGASDTSEFHQKYRVNDTFMFHLSKYKENIDGTISQGK